MGKLSLAGVVGNLDAIIRAVREITPIIEQIPGVGPVVANVATIGIAAVGAIQNLLERKDDLKEVLSSQDEAKLRAMLAELQEVNDQLATAIAADTGKAAEDA